MRVVVVSGDRAMLVHAHRFLAAFGYEVLTAADAAQAAAAAEAASIDFLLLDDRLPDVLEACRSLQSTEYRAGFCFLMTPRRSTGEISSLQVGLAVAAGVDDFLARPLVYGECLARLRAAARAMENGRRYDQQQGVEPITQLPSRPSFCRTLSYLLHEAPTANRSVTCALVDLDYFHRVALKFGRRAEAELLQEVAVRLAQLTPSESHLACLGADRFAVVIANGDERTAVAEIQRMCSSLADHDFPVGEQKIKLTASAGVACQQGGDVEQFIRHAEQALQLAKKSGRDCVVTADRARKETSDWLDLAGRLFDSTTARDVMTPCPVTLNLNDPFHRATSLFEQTQLLAIPVVDDHAFVGVVWRESFVNGQNIHETYPAGHLNGKLCEQLDEAVNCVAEETSFVDLVELLSVDEARLLVVVDQQRPTGYVTAPALAALSEPLRADCFRSRTAYDDSPRYLAINDQPV